MQAKLKKEEQEKQAMDSQMELAMRVQEEKRLRGETEEEEPPAPVDLGKDHQQISFSFSGIIFEMRKNSIYENNNSSEEKRCQPLSQIRQRWK